MIIKVDGDPVICKDSSVKTDGLVVAGSSFCMQFCEHCAEVRGKYKGEWFVPTHIVCNKSQGESDNAE